MKRSDREALISFIIIISTAIAMFIGVYYFFDWKGILIVFLLLIVGVIWLAISLYKENLKKEKEKLDDEQRRRQNWLEMQIVLEEKRKKEEKEKEKKEKEINNMHSKWGVQSFNELEKITDQILLADIAKTAPAHYLTPLIDKIGVYGVKISEKISMYAVKKITDQNVLVDIAKKAADSTVRLAAAEKILDQTISQSVFVSLAKDDDDDVRLAAVQQLTNPDQALLSVLIDTERFQSVRRVIVEKLTDQKVLERVARDNSWGWYDNVQVDAAKKIINPKIRKEIEEAIRVKAVNQGIE